MSVIGILSNAHSRRNSRSMADVHAVISAYPGVTHVTIHRFTAMPEALNALARRGVEHLVISGGDGTVHAIVTELINASPFPKPPRLSLLAGGTTNVIARDVASLEHPAWALKRLLERSRQGDPGEAVKRSTIGLSHSGESQRIYGFLAGAIGFYQGTMLTRHKGKLPGNRRHRALGPVSILSTLADILRHGFGEKSGFLPEQVGVKIDHGTERESELLLFMATTLEKLVPGFMPFWGEGRGAMRVTTIAAPGAHFLRALACIMMRRPKPWMKEQGYESYCASQAALRISSPVLMDGEIFMPDSSGIVELAAGPTIAFARY